MMNDAPAIVVAARDRLLLCPTVTSPATGLGIASAEIWYPECDLLQADLPVIVVNEADYTAERSAPGERFGRGQISIMIYVQADLWTAGRLETVGTAIANELVEVDDPGTVFVIRARRSLASKPRRGKTAAARDQRGLAYRTLLISADWEG